MDRVSIKVEYRNSIRSKAMIRMAFSQLLKEKPYCDIKASDVIERADIARATFYAHFEDMDALLLAVSESVIDEVSSMLTPVDMSNLNSVLPRNTETILHFIARDRVYIQLLISALSVSPALTKLIDSLSSKLSYLGDKKSLSYAIAGSFYFVRSLVMSEAPYETKEASDYLSKHFLLSLETAIAE